MPTEKRRFERGSSAYKLKPGRASRASRIASAGVIVSSRRSLRQLPWLACTQPTYPELMVGGRGRRNGIGDDVGSGLCLLDYAEFESIGEML